MISSDLHRLTRSQKSHRGDRGNHLLGHAVHEQIEVLEYDRADQGRVAFRFADGREDAVSSQELDKHALDGAAPARRPSA